MSISQSVARETATRPEAPVSITAHGEGWHDIPYIRRDIHQSELAQRDAKLEAIRAVVRRWVDSDNRDNGDSMVKIIDILYRREE